MPTTVYRISLSKNRARFRLGTRAMIVFAFLLVPIAVFTSLDARQAGGPAKLDSLGFQPARILLVLYLATLAWILTVIAGNVYAIRPSGNFMTLEKSGLTYARLGFHQRWSWQNLPEFGVTVHPEGAKVLEFRSLSAGDWRAYLGSWRCGWPVAGSRAAGASSGYRTNTMRRSRKLLTGSTNTASGRWAADSRLSAGPPDALMERTPLY